MLKKLLLTTSLVLGLTLSSFAENNTESPSLFNGNEFSLNLGTSYAVENGFKDTYDFNADVGLSYFVNKYIGIDTLLPVYSNHGVSVDRVSLGLTVRVPVKFIAPYVSAGTSYRWSEENFDYYAAGGVQVRLNSKWGVFTEYRYIIDDFDNKNASNGAGNIRAGISLVF